MTAATQVQLKSAGGSIWTFDLPLKETFVDQLRKGELAPADDESAGLLAAYLASVDLDLAQQTVVTPLAGPDRPSAAASKAVWLDYAAAVGMTGLDDSMTRKAIIEAIDNPAPTTVDPAEPGAADDDVVDENEPPREGDGATIEAWREYAVEELGLEIPDDATVADVIAKVDELDDDNEG